MQPENLKSEPASYRKRHSTEVEEAHKELAHDESNWLVSYADMMTLLFGFFVLLYSFSKIDKDKFTVIRKEVASYFGGQVKENPAVREVVKDIEENTKESGIDPKDIAIQARDSSIILNIQSELLFASGSAELGQDSIAVLGKIISSIKRHKMINKISVEGHTDDVPISSALFPTNWELSAARSSRVVRQFEAGGFPSDRLKAEGYGSSLPLAANRDKEGRIIPENLKTNRRVVINVDFGHDVDAASKALHSPQFSSKEMKDPDEKGRELILEGQEASQGLTSEDLKKRAEQAQARLNQANMKMKEIQKAEREKQEIEKLKAKVLEMENRAKELEKEVQTKSNSL